MKSEESSYFGNFYKFYGKKNGRDSWDFLGDIFAESADGAIKKFRGEMPSAWNEHYLIRFVLEREVKNDEHIQRI